ncbi:Nicotinate degradation protein S [Betaproteobacteria bacterium MOLA814]|nr:Nicotinate degradation protein S [Betaproteobacteria bacterium MOLA814]
MTFSLGVYHYLRRYSVFYLCFLYRVVHNKNTISLDESTAMNKKSELPDQLMQAHLEPFKNTSKRAEDAQRTKADILKAAAHEFGEKGLAGARVDEIAAATRTSKRMIYYYFASKDGLYLATLEAVYRAVRESESQLNLDAMAPETALRCLTAVTFDHHLNNEDYIRMVMSENINRGRYLAKSAHVKELNRPAIRLLTRIYERGLKTNIFRPNLDPADIHASISALSFFNVSNQYTFGLIFQQDNRAPEYIANRRENVVQMVLRYVML